MRRIITFFLFFIFSITFAQAQVKAFSELNFHGTELVLQPGTYTMAQLQKRGLPQVRSLRVPKGCNVKQYENANLQGKANSYSKNKPKLLSNSSSQSVKVSCSSAGTPFSIAASDEYGQQGDLIVVDVNVSDFNKVVSMQYSMNWDPSILQFEKVQGFQLKDLSAQNFGTEQSKDGNLLMAWYDASVQGVNLASGTVLYQVVFRVVGKDTSKSRIRFSGKPLIIEVMKADGTPLPFNNINGSFTFE